MIVLLRRRNKNPGPFPGFFFVCAPSGCLAVIGCHGLPLVMRRGGNSCRACLVARRTAQACAWCAICFRSADQS
jgi:hypothetical protein